MALFFDKNHSLTSLEKCKFKAFFKSIFLLLKLRLFLIETLENTLYSSILH